MNPEDASEEPEDTPVDRFSTPTVNTEPSTPSAQTGPNRNLVTQTPISALVESIQKGFLFTPASRPLFSVNEGDSYDSTLGLDEASLKTEPLAWQCKPLVITKPSS